MLGLQIHVVAGRPGHGEAVSTYEIVVRGRFSPALIEATGTDSARFAAGVTALVADDCDQARLHSLFNFLRDVNVTLESVNAVVPTTD